METSGANILKQAMQQTLGLDRSGPPTLETENGDNDTSRRRIRMSKTSPAERTPRHTSEVGKLGGERERETRLRTRGATSEDREREEGVEATEAGGDEATKVGGYDE